MGRAWAWASLSHSVTDTRAQAWGRVRVGAGPRAGAELRQAQGRGLRPAWVAAGTGRCMQGSVRPHRLLEALLRWLLLLLRWLRQRLGHLLLHALWYVGW